MCREFTRSSSHGLLGEAVPEESVHCSTLACEWFPGGAAVAHDRYGREYREPGDSEVSRKKAAGAVAHDRRYREPGDSEVSRKKAAGVSSWFHG